MRKFLEEIQRRNVTKVALVYIIAGWLTMQVVDVMFPALKLAGVDGIRSRRIRAYRIPVCGDIRVGVRDDARGH